MSGWLAADGCRTYARPYGVWEETQQCGELGHGGGSSAQHSAQQADWGTAAKSNLFDKSDCCGWCEGQRVPLYLPTLAEVSEAAGLPDSRGKGWFRWRRLGPGERLMAGDVERRHPESWAASSLPRQGIPTAHAKGREEEVSWACFSKHQAWFKCTKRGAPCVVLEGLSSNRICDCFNVPLVAANAQRSAFARTPAMLAHEYLPRVCMCALLPG